MAQALAVLGDDTELRLLAGLADLDVDTTAKNADELRAGAIFDRGVPLRFIHPLVRNALYSGMPAGERTAAHRRAAALLGGQGASPEKVAVHLLATDGRAEREAVETLRQAAARALARGAPQSAVAYLARALREPPPPDLRVAVIRPLMPPACAVGDRSALAPILAEVVAELEEDTRALISSAADLGTWLAFFGRLDQATALLERAIDAAAHENEIDSAIQLEAQLIALDQLPPAAARARLERYRGRLAPDSAGERLVMALDALLECWAGGSARKASQSARRAFHESKIFAEQPGVMATRLAVVALIFADELDAAERAIESVLPEAQQRGSTGG